MSGSRTADITPEALDALAAALLEAFELGFGREDADDLAVRLIALGYTVTPVASPVASDETRYPCKIKVNGGIGACLTLGTDYRVAEIVSHIEPSGVEGVLGHETTVIRFDPTPAASPVVDVERHRFRLGAKGRCEDCGRVYSNPAHRKRMGERDRPLTRAVGSITVEEMVDALLDVRLGVEGRDDADQHENTRYYAERLLARLRTPDVTSTEANE